MWELVSQLHWIRVVLGTKYFAPVHFDGRCSREAFGGQESGVGCFLGLRITSLLRISLFRVSRSASRKPMVRKRRLQWTFRNTYCPP